MSGSSEKNVDLRSMSGVPHSELDDVDLRSMSGSSEKNVDLRGSMSGSSEKNVDLRSMSGSSEKNYVDLRSMSVSSEKNVDVRSMSGSGRKDRRYGRTEKMHHVGVVWVRRIRNAPRGGCMGPGHKKRLFPGEHYNNQSRLLKLGTPSRADFGILAFF